MQNLKIKRVQNVFGADEGLSGFRSERFFKHLVFKSSVDMKSPN